MEQSWLLWCPAGGVPALESAPGADVVRSDDLVAAASGAITAAETADAHRGGRLASPAGPAAALVLDPRSGRVTAVRDRTGLHPLFYATGPSGWGVSPEARRLVARLGRAPSRVAVAAWLTGAPLLPAETLLEGLHRVPAGHLLTLADGRAGLERVWEPPVPGSLPAGAAAEFGSRLESAVAAAGDAGVAVLLSGGIDSSAVAAAAARSGGRPPVALCVDFAGASERAIQERVAAGLGLRRLGTKLSVDASLLERGVERLAGSLWPTAALWAPVFDDLVKRARDEEGVGLVLDGQGGDDLLDAGLAGGRALLRRPSAFLRWVQAEGRYTGHALGSVRAAVSRPVRPGLPGWLADDALRGELEERLAAAPRSYAGVRQADLVDGLLAAQREETFDWAARHGLRQLHPLWDARVVELLDALPAAALVAGGEPKAPARRYLRERVPSVTGSWPRPALASAPMDAIRAGGAKLLRQRLGGPRRLVELGILAENTDLRDFQVGEVVSTLSLESWFQEAGGRGVP